MPIYYGSKISDNMVKTPEGYLICRNVPIGRTGWMKYRGEEVGEPQLAGQMVDVYRSPEELFSKATLASFEGKTVTNDHPKNLLNVENVNMEHRGHVQNVRQEGEYLMADLLVTDKHTIDMIEAGKREVSCGYDCYWEPLNEDHTKWEQKEIIGNHVAIVIKGRAGDKVAIKDSAPTITEEVAKKMPKKMSKTLLQAIGFKAFVADAEPEEVAEAMKAMSQDEEPNEKPAEDSGEPDALQKILTAVEALTERVTALEQSDKQVHEEMGAEDEFAAMVEEPTEEPMEVEDEASEVVESEEEGEEKKMAADSAMFNAAKTAILAIPDKKLRDAAAKSFRKSVADASPKTQTNGYAAVIGAVNANKKKAAADSASKTVSLEQQAMSAAEAFNAAGAKMRGGK